MLKIMADYGAVAAMETFTNTRNDRHPEELARLDGPRLVVANETEDGHRWRENRIKQLTGGDPITARFMHKDSFTYMPKFKLTFLGNHAPSISNLDHAIQRRFVVVPFNCKPKEPDTRLAELLEQEFPGILRWAINGAVEWYTKGGLAIPKAVKDATTRYFDEQNIFRQWLEECCFVGQGVEKTVELFDSWATFAKSHGEEPGNQRSFNERLRFAGFEPKQIRDLKTKGVMGIQLKQHRAEWNSI
jgi:putative DNA primase/helicase